MRGLIAWKNDQRGNVLMLTGLAILILFAVAGAGVDFGRQQLVRMKLQNASDAAAIAAASLPESTSVEQRRAVALRYFNLNFPSTYLGIARPTPNIQIGDQIIVDAGTSFETNFISNVDVQRLEAQGRTVVDRTTQAASIYDVILVMDNSGSMSNVTTAPNFSFTPQANVTNSRNLKLPECVEEMRSYFSNACARGQYSHYMADLQTVRTYSPLNCQFNAPTEYCNYVSNSASINKTNEPNRGLRVSGFGFLGNVRLNALRSVALNFITRIIDEGEPGSRVAIVPWAESVRFSQALTTNATSLRQAINQMGAWGGTNPRAGMAQANSYAASFNQRSIKAVVLMSDGKPTMNGPIRSNGYDDSGCDGQLYCSPAANATLPLCTQLKNKGVQVYTIGFLNPNDSEFQNEPGSYNRAVDFLRGCASVDGEGNPRFYTAQDGVELDQAFAQILTSLGRIRISQ